MRRNPRRDTGPELALRSELHRRGLRFRKDLPLRVPGRVVRPDVVFTRARLAVFIDGCFWHRCPEHGTSPRSNSDYWRTKLDRNVARDHRVDEALAAAGWRSLREACRDGDQRGDATVTLGHDPLSRRRAEALPPSRRT